MATYIERMMAKRATQWQCDTCNSFNDNTLALCGSCSAPKDGEAAPAAASGAGSLLSAGAGSLLSATPAAGAAGSLLGGSSSLLGTGSLLSSGGGSLLTSASAATSGGSLLAAQPGSLLAKPSSGSLLGAAGSSLLAGAQAQPPPSPPPPAKDGALANGDAFPVIASAPISASDDSPAAHDLATPVNSATAGAPGSVWTWGLGDCEQLGHGEEEVEVPHPKLVAQLAAAGVRFVRVVAGGLHNLGLTAEGHVWSWGCNDDGPLGRADTDSTDAQRVTGGGLERVTVTAIAAGDCHSLALDSSGRVWWWGAYKGREGHMQHEGVGGEKLNTTPTMLPDFSRRYGKAVRIASGLNHSIVITAKGVAIAWGMGEAGQLGKAVVTAFLRGQRHNRALLVPNPVYVWEEGVKAVKSKAVKWARAWGVGFSTYLQDVAGRLWVCGLNNYGQLGMGDQVNRLRPVLIADPRGGEAPLHGRVAAVAGGQHFTLLLTDDGAVYGMGRGDSGQLGLSAEAGVEPPFAAATFLPQRIPQQRFGGAKVVQIAGAGAFSMALTADGRVWAWGYGDMGQLGNGKDSDETLPFDVTAVAGELDGATALQVAAGDQHGVLLGLPGTPTAGQAAKRSRAE